MNKPGGNPLISVISVVFNGAATLERLLQSIIDQNYDKFELIIIDGGSVDGTKELIEKYSSSIQYWISEPDGGIYDAMNKGIKAARGEWLYFIGCDDTLYSNDVLSEAAKHFCTECDIVYGNTIRVNDRNKNQGIRSIPPRGVNMITMYKTGGICHQAVFAKNTCFEDMFDTKYKLAADFKWIITKIRKKSKFKYMDLDICCYNDSGASSNTCKLRKELLDILKSEYGYFPYIIRKYYWALKGIVT